MALIERLPVSSRHRIGPLFAVLAGCAFVACATACADVGADQIAKQLAKQRGNEMRGDCDLVMAQAWVGSRVIDGMVTSGTNAIPTDIIPEPYRILGPRSKMTMDLRPDRLNLYVDKSGVIERVSCG